MDGHPTITKKNIEILQAGKSQTDEQTISF